MGQEVADDGRRIPSKVTVNNEAFAGSLDSDLLELHCVRTATLAAGSYSAASEVHSATTNAHSARKRHGHFSPGGPRTAADQRNCLDKGGCQFGTSSEGRYDVGLRCQLAHQRYREKKWRPTRRRTGSDRRKS